MAAVPLLRMVLVLARVLALASRLGLHFPESPLPPNSNHHDCRLPYTTQEPGFS